VLHVQSRIFTFNKLAAFCISCYKSNFSNFGCIIIPLGYAPAKTYYISRTSWTTRNVLWSRASVCVCVCMCLCVWLSVCLCVCLSLCPRPHAYTIARTVTWGSGRGCPLVVHYSADLQSVHGLRCCGNVTRTRNVSEYMLVLAPCLVDVVAKTVRVLV